MLYKHNQQVYKELCDILEYDNKAIVIACTGHGKTYIVKEYLEQHDTTALVVVPRVDLMSTWEKNSNRVQAITYQSFTDKKNQKDYPVVVYDEVHHIGSEVWGAAVQEYMQQHPETKFIGVTADPIRYSDSRRDVSTEYFNGNIAMGYTTAEAIRAGILPSFNYVATLIDSDAVLEKTQKSIRKAKHNKKLLENLSAKLQYTLENQMKISDILKKHMPKGNRKGIVFVENIKAIDDGIALLKENGLQPVWSIHSEKSKKENAATLTTFENAEEGWLVAVDKLNEGLHINGINTLLFCRRTRSKSVFMQQLGRAMSTDNIGKNIVVFDLVGNHNLVAARELLAVGARAGTENGIANANSNLIEEDKTTPNEIIVYDYTEAGIAILEKIDSLLNDTWTKEDDDYLCEHYLVDKTKECAQYLGRTTSSVHQRARVLGLVQNCYWTKEDDDYLRVHYQKDGAPVCAEHLGRTTGATRNHARRLGLTQAICDFKDDDEYLRKHYKKDGCNACAEHLGRTVSATQQRAKRLGLTESHPWSAEEEEYLRTHFESDGAEACAKHLGRTVTAIKKRYLVKIVGVTARTNYWTEAEDAYLREHYATDGAKCCAEYLGRKQEVVRQHAAKLGVTPPRKWTESDNEYVRIHYHKDGAAACAEHLGRTINAIRSCAMKLGITKKQQKL